MGRRRGHPDGDVTWHVPGKKKPIARCHKASMDLIIVLSQEFGTIEEVYKHINYDVDARRVLKAYIDKGYG